MTHGYEPNALAARLKVLSLIYLARWALYNQVIATGKVCAAHLSKDRVLVADEGEVISDVLREGSRIKFSQRHTHVEDLAVVVHVTVVAIPLPQTTPR